MPFNGSGQFLPKHTWVNEAASGTAILPANFDDQDGDMAAGLSNTITRDGQAGPTNDIPWNNFGITDLRDPTIASGAATKNYVDAVDAATRTWVGATTTALPAQAGNAGKALVTDGSQASWQQVYPVQTGNAGKFLATDGTTMFWASTLKASIVRFADGTDATKLAAFDLSGLTTGTTRTLALPDASGTVALRTDIAMQLITQVTVSSSVANVNFLTTFSSAYDKYVIELENLTFSASDLLAVRVAVGGVALSSTSYNSTGINNSSATSAGLSQFNINTGNLITSSSGTLEIGNANLAVYKHISYKGMANNGSGGFYSSLLLGFASIGNALTGFQLFAQSGANITGGNIRVYGIRNS